MLSHHSTRDGNQSDRNHVDLLSRSESRFSGFHLKPVRSVTDRTVDEVQYGLIGYHNKYGPSPGPEILDLIKSLYDPTGPDPRSTEYSGALMPLLGK